MVPQHPLLRRAHVYLLPAMRVLPPFTIWGPYCMYGSTLYGSMHCMYGNTHPRRSDAHVPCWKTHGDRLCYLIVYLFLCCAVLEFSALEVSDSLVGCGAFCSEDQDALP